MLFTKKKKNNRDKMLVTQIIFITEIVDFLIKFFYLFFFVFFFFFMFEIISQEKLVSGVIQRIVIKFYIMVDYDFEVLY